MAPGKADETPKVLILCEDENEARRIANSLIKYDVTAVAASSVDNAILRLKEQPFDMVIAESKLGKSSGLTFLAQAHRYLPTMQRVVIETAPLEITTNALVNEVAPSAIFPGTIDPEKVRQLLNQAFSRLAVPTSQPRVLSRPAAPVGRLGAAMDETEKIASVMEISMALTNLIENPNISLPILPEVAMRVREVIEDDQQSFAAIAEIVETEQGMASRILQVANSPIYAGLERIKNLQQAVSRLGLRETRNIIQAVISQNLFRTEHRHMVEIMRQLWLHSITTAYANEMIAQRLQIPESSDYFMMGLLHDIGKLLIIHLACEGEKKGLWKSPNSVSEGVIRRVFAMRHNDLGARLLEKWNYPASFQTVVRLHNDRYEIEQRHESVVVTYISNLLTRKLGFSLLPYDNEEELRHAMLDALNMTEMMGFEFENDVRLTTEKIKGSCFGMSR
ncbi:MAG TPA: response regulator [Candidatus Sumerlaeota bacterium]|nr:response regulator [Candidatus Sumerlaeota bacterium]HPS00156.1 response regulator [Candidatus Sumerlaeota bacterium]